MSNLIRLRKAYVQRIGTGPLKLGADVTQHDIEILAQAKKAVGNISIFDVKFNLSLQAQAKKAVGNIAIVDRYVNITIQANAKKAVANISIKFVSYVNINAVARKTSGAFSVNCDPGLPNVISSNLDINSGSNSIATSSINSENNNPILLVNLIDRIDLDADLISGFFIDYPRQKIDIRPIIEIVYPLSSLVSIDNNNSVQSAEQLISKSQTTEKISSLFFCSENSGVYSTDALYIFHSNKNNDSQEIFSDYIVFFNSSNIYPIKNCFTAYGSGYLKPGKSVYNQLSETVYPCVRYYPDPGKGKIQLSVPARNSNQISIGCRTKYIYIKRKYLVQTSASLIRISDGLEIPAISLTVPADADSWSGNFSATLNSIDALQLIRTSNQNDPVVVESRIQEHAWRWVVESWSWDREFTNNSIKIEGKNQLTLLSDRYHSVRTYTENEDRNISQLAAQELPVGWEMNWGSADWLVPAGAWAYQNLSPLEAISRLVKDSGSILIPSKTELSITVRPRYGALPWNYYTSAPSLTIPASAIVSQSRNFKGRIEADGIYVHGESIGGVSVFVKKTGTSGANLIKTIGRALVTDVAAARAIGSRELAANQQAPEIASIRIPLGGEFPLIEIGTMISITENDEDIRGCVSSVNISATSTNKGGLSVWQDITIGENSENLWVQFDDLLPKNPLLIGTMTIKYDDNTSVLAMIGGGALRVKGTGIVGHKYYVRNERIEDEAPDMPTFEIEV